MEDDIDNIKLVNLYTLLQICLFNFSSYYSLNLIQSKLLQTFTCQKKSLVSVMLW